MVAASSQFVLLPMDEVFFERGPDGTYPPRMSAWIKGNVNRKGERIYHLQRSCSL